MSRIARPVALVGISGSGKSAVGPLLAARLEGRCEDLDARLEAETGLRISEIFERQGEEAFRLLEAGALARAIEERPRVIACGGGVVTTEPARRLLITRCWTAWLEVSPREAARRIGAARLERPLLRGEDASLRLTRLLDQRAGWYAEVASARIPTDGRSAAQVADGLARELETLGSRGAKA